MKGKLIIIEGSDGSGKATQCLTLFSRLQQEGVKVKKIEFPDYNSESSALIKMYLKGDFGSAPGDVNAYTASTFYAVDRFASYKMKWEQFYNEGGIILADRYTTSNMIHQAAKIDNVEEREAFLDWLWNFEFNLFALPKPDMVFFLDVPPIYSKQLMSNRANKFTGEEEKDIHERDFNFLENSYNNAKAIAAKYGWLTIDCIQEEKILSIEDINNKIYSKVAELLKK